MYPKKVNVVSAFICILMLSIVGCADSKPGTDNTGKMCTVTEGPNKGKKGRYDTEGSCCDADKDGVEVPGGWGCTDCKGSNCKDGHSLPETDLDAVKPNDKPIDQ
ncbi:hypothetical protein [Microbulbifer guangxiensis]|uniref:hypothetical protein n=1 Tax=Microbulbifer guangxiensis TaxID=2904249 RepID=UPI001F4400EC|nr:hypothetical protein [Microbulbifer guangxiensis]